MGIYTNQANNAKEKLELAKQKIIECEEQGNNAKNKVVENKDSLASGIITSNNRIIDKCKLAIDAIEKYEVDIMNTAQELDAQLEAEERARREAEEQARLAAEETGDDNGTDETNKSSGASR